MEMYKISFPCDLTEKEYIGISSKGAKRRFTEHCASKKKYPIVMALKKYGKDNAILTVLGSFDNYDDMYEAEKSAIIQYNTKAPFGFNLTDGGKGAYGLPASEERKRKISEANKGRKHTKEAREKISKATNGRDYSIQVRAMVKANKVRKMSEKQRLAIADTWIGRKHTEESKIKMSLSASKRKASESTREKMSESIRIAKGDILYKFENPEGKTVKTKNMKLFCIENNLSSTHMYNVHNGKVNSHKGWKLSTN